MMKSSRRSRTRIYESAKFYFVLFALLMSGSACESAKTQKRDVTPVRVQSVQEYQSGNPIRYSANIQPRHEVQLAFKAGGYVEKFLRVRDADGILRDVQSGDFVKRGTILASLRKSDFQAKEQQAVAQLKQAEAGATNSTAELDRATKLLQSESLTKSDFDAAEARDRDYRARVDAARAQLDEARIALRDSDLRAPIDAFVIQRNLEIGDLASPGTPAFVIADTTSVKGIFGVPDVLVSRFQIGQKLAVLLEAVPGSELQGIITRISPAADQRNRLFETEISIPNPDNRLRPGMIATIVVKPAGVTTSVLVVPLTSVIAAKSKSDHYAVMVVDSQQGKTIAELREITLGETFGDRISVLTGLNAGEKVITIGASLVQAGEEVRIIP